ncbi:MAG: hypothetical protein WBC04_26015 [Candidatus Acidiferrales bacterium]
MPIPRVDSRTASRSQTRAGPPSISSTGISATPSAQIDALGGNPNFMAFLARGLAVVPVRNSSGKGVAARNVGTHPQRVSLRDMQTKLLPHLQAAAQELRLLLR